MVEWFLPWFPSWCTNHWFFSGEAVTLLHHRQLLFACCCAQVWAAGCFIARKTEIVPVRCRQEQLPAQHYLCLQCWRTEGRVMAWEADHVKTELIWGSEFTFGFSWVNACVECPGAAVRCPTGGCLWHGDSGTRGCCRQGAWSGASGISMGREKGLTGG